ncbi:pimeloyl-ACP methyl ester carboxylesterase [Salana multivorans]|uniref:Pimeloyl-ACP methyl ester carboxylesterase n=1 Tax=Salana multivorans TaxID=120377 RepID=A0A3N2D2A3_9MICO|nr:alpha/beta hydrolase [Salana multivorans]ROR93906.1 pimeloyl-ACP methyl ester carboxylesterase [Salana multivorans]
MDLDRLRHPGDLVGPLWVVVAGYGPPLVLLHGNSESHRVFDRLVPLLAPRFTLVGIDSRGHGRSPRGDGELRIVRMADDVADVLTRLGLAGAPVVGFSDGGNIALELALRHPGVAGRLVIVGANLDPGGLAPFSLLWTEAAHAVSRVGARFLPRVAPLGSLSERLGLMTRDPEIDAGALRRVTQPVLVVVGERDVIRPEHTDLIVSALPDARLLRVAGVGHMVPWDAAPELAAAVERFLRPRGA